jgi:sugar O-acyltransferase (sialic acid O-acetyltransferase NeuD family)
MTTEPQAIFIFGASGHAKVVIDIIERHQRYAIAAVFDDNTALDGHGFFGYPVAGGREALLRFHQQEGIGAGIVAIGDNRMRAGLAGWLVQQGIARITAIHPNAQIGRGADIGAGSVLMAGCVVNADTVIGSEVILNTGATVDHDCRIGDAVHIAPGSHLCGNVTVGAGSFIGAGCTVIPGVNIGTNVVVGAGSTVLQDIPNNTRVAGSPCRAIN